MRAYNARVETLASGQTLHVWTRKMARISRRPNSISTENVEIDCSAIKKKKKKRTRQHMPVVDTINSTKHVYVDPSGHITVIAIHLKCNGQTGIVSSQYLGARILVNSSICSKRQQNTLHDEMPGYYWLNPMCPQFRRITPIYIYVFSLLATLKRN